MPGAQRTAVGLVGNDGRVDASRLEGLPGVQEVIHVSKPYKQVSREWQAENTVVRLAGGITGGGTQGVALGRPRPVLSGLLVLEAGPHVHDAATLTPPAGPSHP